MWLNIPNFNKVFEKMSYPNWKLDLGLLSSNAFGFTFDCRYIQVQMKQVLALWAHSDYIFFWVMCYI